uniref:Uncharacterized protein n=1 Tax=Anguilla anguilla TaxID=7936 RepID=A0A0E9QIV1_ANGAN
MGFKPNYLTTGEMRQFRKIQA